MEIEELVNVALKGKDFEIDLTEDTLSIITDSNQTEKDVLGIIEALSPIGLFYIGKEEDVEYEDKEGDPMKYMNLYTFVLAYSFSDDSSLLDQNFIEENF